MKKILFSLLFCCGCSFPMTNTITPNISDKISVLVVGVGQSEVYGTCIGVSQ